MFDFEKKSGSVMNKYQKSEEEGNFGPYNLMVS
jgi:hypothetical protein